MLENNILNLQSKIDKDLMCAERLMSRLNELISQYNTKLTIIVSDKGIFANEELHYKVTTINRKHIEVRNIEVFGMKAQNTLDDIYAVLYQVSCNQNRLYELKQVQWKQFDDTTALITELQQKHSNHVERITWEMVKRHIVSTLKQAQEVIGHLYKSNIIEETDRVYSSDSIKIFVRVVPVTEIDEYDELNC